MDMETQQGPLRVCWNNWITPHNHEGFALNLGDMLVKAGDLKAGKRMYEKRLANLGENTELFRRPTKDVPKGRLMMFASEANCAGCHADAPAISFARAKTRGKELSRLDHRWAGDSSPRPTLFGCALALIKYQG